MSDPQDKPKVREDKIQYRRETDVDISKNIGYMLAKFENLDTYIRDHMRQEEGKFEDIFKSIKRIQFAVIVLTFIVILMASGVPIEGFVLKLIGLLL